MTRLKYNEIKKIITEQLGFKTHDDWKKYLESAHPAPTLEQIALLSPDNVDCKDFWRVTEDLFGTDPVCNSSDPRTNGPYGSPLSIMESNRSNLWLAKQLNILHYIDEFAYAPNCVIVEIGAGYGSLKNYIETNTKNQYYGFDVVPRVGGVMPMTEEGKFETSLEPLYGRVQDVISTNVFQHLSNNQRLYFFDEIANLLRPGGLFIFNGMIDKEEPKSMRCEDGFNYMNLYGQLTPKMKYNWLKKELEARNFRVHMYSERFDYVFSMVAQLKPPAFHKGVALEYK